MSDNQPQIEIPEQANIPVDESYWALVSEDNIVVNCIVIPNLKSEKLEKDYISQELMLSGIWVKMYKDGRRGRYAGIGYSYDSEKDAFIPPTKYPSWTLDENYNWVPPIPFPDDGNKYFWDELNQSWKLIDI